jgi:hypothetical protein
MRARYIVAAAMLAVAGPLAAEDRRDDARFGVSVLGLRVVELRLAGAEAPSGAYAARVAITTTGAARAVARVRFEAEVTGRRARGDWRPDRYTESADTGRRQSAARLVFTDGTAQVVTDTAGTTAGRAADPLLPVPSDWALGAVDPMTALYAAMRDLTPGEDCALDLRIFDGIRASRVRIAPSGDGQCRGEYRRVGGFPARDMAERAAFPLVLMRADRGDGWQRLVRAEVATLWGTAVLVRDD